MKYRISESAYNDLNEIYFYTHNKWSEIQADKYFESVIQEIEILSKNPEKGKRMTNIKVDFFYFKILSHYIFYKKNDEQIEIIRILHKMMDFSQHLD